MPLALGVYENDKLYVGGECVEVVRIVSRRSTHMVVLIGDTAHDIVDDRMAEVMPDVLMGAGIYDPVRKVPKLLISAPRAVKIVRGGLLERK